jgi:hypothetical protein
LRASCKNHRRYTNWNSICRSWKKLISWWNLFRRMLVYILNQECISLEGRRIMGLWRKDARIWMLSRMRLTKLLNLIMLWHLAAWLLGNKGIFIRLEGLANVFRVLVFRRIFSDMILCKICGRSLTHIYLNRSLIILVNSSYMLIVWHMWLRGASWWFWGASISIGGELISDVW